MRKDQLAAGARTAKFAVGGTVIPGADDNIFRNVAPEGERNEEIITVEHAPVVRKIFRPRGTTVLVQRMTQEELSTVILAPEAVAKEQPAEGTVVAVGPKIIDLHHGERIVFGKYAGTEFKLNGEILLIMDEEDIKGTIEDVQPITRGGWGDVSGCIGRA